MKDNTTNIYPDTGNERTQKKDVWRYLKLVRVVKRDPNQEPQITD